MISRSDLTDLLETELGCAKVRDYCPNGLQVEGKAQISKVVTGVTASQALIDHAIAVGADAIIVHHGYFWKGEAPEVVGMKKARLQRLLKHDINLFAYHLPLDIHPTLGNNAQLGQLFGVSQVRPVLTVEPIGVLQSGEFAQSMELADVAALIAKQLGREPLVQDAGIGAVKKLAWCSGGGQGYIEAAAALGVDLFISGEVSEQTIHCSNELGIHFIAAGHHATERYGVKALGEWLAANTDLDVEFIDIYNPA